MKKIAVILSGCGFKDGAEVTEAVSTLIALSECKAQYQVFAPDQSFSAVDHITNQNENDRNALAESTRISRGNSKPLSELNPETWDGLVFPGGFGAALNLCTWGKKGAQCDVLPEIETVIHKFHNEGKPIAAICIAPALLARVLGDQKISVTIGKDPETAREIEKTGAQHVECLVDDFVSDREAKVITTPAYMYDKAPPHQVFNGVKKTIQELVKMA